MRGYHAIVGQQTSKGGDMRFACRLKEFELGIEALDFKICGLNIPDQLLAVGGYEIEIVLSAVKA